MVTAVFKCVQKWKSHLRNYQEAATDLDPHQASLTLVRAAQRQSFGCVVDKMQSGVTYESAVKLFPVSKRERWMFSITKFVPFLDQYGILRMGGRLTECNELSDEQAHPAFLPKRHKITELFIIAYHNKLAHRAAETVLASLQNDAGLYPIGGIATVRHYLADCFNCKLLRKERACQLMAPLPEYRITPRQPVFLICLHRLCWTLRREKRSEAQKSVGYVYLCAMLPQPCESSWLNRWKPLRSSTH